MPTSLQIRQAKRAGVLAASVAAFAVGAPLLFVFGVLAVGAYQGHAGILLFPAIGLSLIVPTVAVNLAAKFAYRRWYERAILRPH